MISSTLNQYKESFKSQLLAFLNEYEDNTKFFFLQNEKTKYQAYQKALIKIIDQVKLFTTAELGLNPVYRNIALDLKKININAYNSIVTELNPVQDETIVSLSAAKKDRIKIDETALENHIKSSIVILKFISDEFEIPYKLDTKVLTDEYQLDQIDNKMWTWLKEYERTNEYIHIPLAIEEKADYVIDTYKNYEERNFKYQLEICNIILEKVPNEKLIIEYKENFEKRLIELRNHCPLPPKNIDVCIDEINNAFYRLELFMKGKVLDYRSFFFNDAFTLLINELNKFENINIKYDSICNTYWYLMKQLDYAYDKGEFENQDAYKNEDFNRDSNEISYIQWYRMVELNGKYDLDDYQFELPSIIDIFNNTAVDKTNLNDDNKTNKLESTDNSNPYPRIFKNQKAYNVFKNLLDEFGTSKDTLANYSFVYHRMKKDELIYDDFQKLQFTYFLLDFNIKIDRIKRMEDIGKIALRESIYIKAK